MYSNDAEQAVNTSSRVTFWYTPVNIRQLSMAKCSLTVVKWG